MGVPKTKFKLKLKNMKQMLLVLAIGMRILVLFSLIILGMTSCKKEVIPSNPPYINQSWEDFYGKYYVTDTLNNTNYILTISQISRWFDGLQFHDSILVENFAGKFNLRINEPELYGANLSIGTFDDVKDHNNLRWSLSGTHYWNESQDSLFLYYSMSNIAFYMDDGVEYYAIINTDLAKKIE